MTNMETTSTAACTIVTRNYLSDARVAASSYLEHHPGARFYTLVIDDLPEGVQTVAGGRLIGVEELELPRFRELCFQCNPTELCCAAKPALLRLLLEKYGEERVIYFDSDVLITRRLEEADASLEGAAIVLTPHLLQPLVDDGFQPDEEHILAAGAFNAGFLAVRKSNDTFAFLDWWQERLRHGFFTFFSGGFLSDQRWLDLVPGLFATAILKDETYNVAYWNLPARRLERSGKSWLVNGRPMAFFHFSGFDPAKPAALSAHQNRIRIERGTALAELLELYVRMQGTHGFRNTRQWKYRYSAFDNGVRISDPMRQLYAQLNQIQRARFGDPFSTGGESSFLTWATEPHRGLNRFLETIYALRADVAATFPDVYGEKRERFLHWAATKAASEFGYDAADMGIASEGAGAPAPRTMTTARCSVVIPVHNKASLTRKCLDSLLPAVAAARNIEVIVVNDASSDNTADVLQTYGSRIRVVTQNQNGGFAVSCNGGAAAASGECLVFLNNDTVGKNAWLDQLLVYADSHPEAAVIGSKLLFPNDTIQHAGMAVSEDGEWRHIYTGFPADHAAVSRSRKFQAVTGACFLVRRDDFESAAGFDTSFHNGYEDVDLCLRLGERGREVHYCAESVLYHLEAATRDVRADDSQNRKLYRERWAGKVRSDELHYYAADQLLKIERRPVYPLGLSVSPWLAVVSGNDREHSIDRLLQTRSHQVYGLLKDTIRLNVLVGELENRPDGALSQGPQPRLAEPRVIHRGQAQWHAEQSSGRVVSVILPVKNGAAKLRKLLPAVLAQQTRDAVEIIAADSASTDESVDLLKEANATVIAIDPRSFNHGLTRNLATRYAQGSILVFLNQSTLPADEQWLANLVRPFDLDPGLAAVCGRMLPREDADLLMAREIARNMNARTERVVTAITDWEDYRSLKPEPLRLFVNFHTLSGAIRAEVFRQLPFRESNFAEDLMWGKDALEAGYRIQYEPTAVAYHSHNYSLLDTFRRNFDDGAACARITGRETSDEQVSPAIVHQVRDDWQYLERECHLAPEELEQWRIAAAATRTVQGLGQWLGVMSERTPEGLRRVLSITEQIKAGAKTETAESWNQPPCR